MEPDKNTTTPAEDEQQTGETQAPADALSRTPDDLEQEQAAAPPPPTLGQPAEKKVSPLKRFIRRANVYFLLFVLIVIIAVAYMVVSYFNSQKPVAQAEIATQELTQDALKQLSNTNASIGNTAQTLTIQGNATIEGQTLMRGNLNVAGNFQTGGSMQGASITVSGAAKLNNTDVNSLQVAQNAAVQGDTTLRNLNVAGTASFNGAVTASQLTVSRLILSGNAVLQIPNHISFTGPSPSRSINSGVLGSGGSASVNGSDTTGTVNISTGNNPSAGCFAHVTFHQVFTNRPHVMVSPVGSAAGRTQYYVNRDTSSFSICTSSPAPANQSFAFDYFVTN